MRNLLALLALFLVSHAQAQIQFDEVAEQAGIIDTGVDGAGVAFWDYDQDGDVDVYINNSDTIGDPLNLHNRLWENDGTGKFRDVSVERGVANLGSLGRGLSWGDYDNDGDTDLALGNMPDNDRGDDTIPTTLYKNLLSETGEPNFQDVTIEAGFIRPGVPRDAIVGGFTDTSGGVSWADYDNDGDLDFLYRNTRDDVDQSLFRNNGDGTFTEVTAEAGVKILDYSLEADNQGSTGWFDFDQDGYVDLLSPNEGHNNVLFHNNGDGTFTEVTRNREPPSGVPFFNEGNANGVCLGDIDNDGDIDGYLPNADQANRLIRNNLRETGEATFTDITRDSGAGNMKGARGCTMADYDNDGFLDIYVSNAGPSNVLFNDVTSDDFPPFVQFYVATTPEHNALYRNNGDGTFSDVTESAHADAYGIGMGVASGDVNNDGFPDIIATGRPSQRNWLFLNKGNDNNWIKVKAIGVEGNKSAFNVRVTVVSGDLEVTRELFSSTGYNSVDDPVMIFGLGNRDTIDSIEIVWPGGTKQHLEGISPGQTVTIIEGQ